MGEGIEIQVLFGGGKQYQKKEVSVRELWGLARIGNSFINIRVKFIYRLFDELYGFLGRVFYLYLLVLLFVY